MEENKKSTEQEQIEEMAKFFRNLDTYDDKECEICGKWVFGPCDELCFSNKLAYEVYNAGYRKIGVVVREIYIKIQKTLASMEYKTNTSRKTVRVEELIEQMDWALHRVVPCAISEVLMKYVYDSDTEDSK